MPAMIKIRRRLEDGMVCLALILLEPFKYETHNSMSYS